jgi:hypothetical protein
MPQHHRDQGTQAKISSYFSLVNMVTSALPIIDDDSAFSIHF